MVLFLHSLNFLGGSSICRPNLGIALLKPALEYQIWIWSVVLVQESSWAVLSTLTSMEVFEQCVQLGISARLRSMSNACRCFRCSRHSHVSHTITSYMLIKPRRRLSLQSLHVSSFAPSFSHAGARLYVSTHLLLRIRWNKRDRHPWGRYLYIYHHQGTGNTSKEPQHLGSNKTIPGYISRGPT